MKTALLTIGHDPIAYKVLRTLSECSDLRAVVYSRRNINQKASKFERIKEYGLWYILQHIISLITRKFFNWEITDKSLKSLGINYRYWHKQSDQSSILNWLNEQAIEVVVICSFQYILKSNFCNQFQNCINIHPAYLPDYRGPEPIFWGLLRNEKTFGITLHRVDSGIDTGSILAQEEVAAPFLKLSILVEYRLAKIASGLLENLIKDIKRGTVFEKEQIGGFYLPAPTLKNRKALIKKPTPEESKKDP